MKKIVEVRGLQKLVAEMEVGRADQDLRQRQRREHDEAQAAASDQDAWARVITAPSLSLALALAWAAQTEQSRAKLRQTQSDVKAAEEEKAERIATWRKCLARAEAAEKLAHRLFARARRDKEDRSLADLSDQISHRRAVA